MKKVTALLTAVALLAGNAGFAQTTTSTGKGASAGRSSGSSNSFAWGIGLGALAAIGLVVGFTCGMAAGNNSH
ncbi:MAG: hypothetical protein KGJ02_04170 [Verrucomicrobiota bacterium]|nr:hypothetical protein [Verrucomicrobiota bacterium]